MKVSVIGTGPVGRTLANGWTRGGMEVTIGSRTPERSLDDTGSIRMTSISDAIDASEVVVIAWPAHALGTLIEKHGEQLEGKLLIDVTNHLTGPPHDPANTKSPFFQEDLWGDGHLSRLYRAFCTVGLEVFAHPTIDGTAAHLPFAGPDTGDRQTVAALTESLGGEPLWLGELPEASSAMDGLARVWFLLALTRGAGRWIAPRFLGVGSEPTANVGPRAT